MFVFGQTPNTGLDGAIMPINCPFVRRGGGNHARVLLINLIHLLQKKSMVANISLRNDAPAS